MEEALKTDDAITHIVVVHCETTTGMLNPAKVVGCPGEEIRQDFHPRRDVLVRRNSHVRSTTSAPTISWSSANKCIQGVPGFSYVICQRAVVRTDEGDRAFS